jgi:hypothetical protein
MHQDNGLQFRSYVPTLMELLEDADGMVRDAAKSTVIELFRYALHILTISSGFTIANKVTGMPPTLPSLTSSGN